MFELLFMLALLVPFMIVLYFATVVAVAVVLGTPAAIVRFVYWVEEKLWS